MVGRPGRAADLAILVDAMERFLFLDDSPERHKSIVRKFGDCLDHAYTAMEAITLLEKNEYAAVMLDHDLGGEESENRMDCEEDGRTVARWIAENARRFGKKTEFFVHSLNQAGAEEMVNIIKASGIWAARWPYIWKEQPGYFLEGLQAREPGIPG